MGKSKDVPTMRMYECGPGTICSMCHELPQGCRLLELDSRTDYYSVIYICKTCLRKAMGLINAAE
jgi:hypothetical protein